MQILTPGYEYYLENLDKEFPGRGGQNIRFITKEKGREGNFVTTFNGTTNEEVLEMLIDRLQFLDNKMPSEWNKNALFHLYGARQMLGRRTANRQMRGVEGTDKP